MIVRNKNNTSNKKFQLKILLRHHILIPVSNGIGNTSSACKWTVLIHALRGEVRNFKILAALLRRVFCVTTDFGTEAGLARVPHIDANELWPHWREDQEIVDDDVLPEMPMPQLVSFDSSMPVPGTEHVCHNVFKHVTKHLPHFKAWLEKARAVANMFCSALYKERFCERCIPEPWFASARQIIMGEIREPIEHRFLSVIEFLEDFLPVKHIVQQHFSAKNMFTKKAVQQDAEKAADKYSERWIDADKVTAALLSEKWWSYGVMLEAMGHAPEHIVYKSRSCKCHPSTPAQEHFADTWSFIRGNRKAGRTDCSTRKRA